MAPFKSMSKKIWQYKVYEMLKDSVKIYYIINQIKLVLFNDFAFYKIKDKIYFFKTKSSVSSRSKELWAWPELDLCWAWAWQNITIVGWPDWILYFVITIALWFWNSVLKYFVNWPITHHTNQSSGSTSENKWHFLDKIGTILKLYIFVN